MKSHYIIIAGPQAAGKTTALKFLSQYYPNVCFFRESREIANSKYKIQGAVSITKKDEIQAISIDFKRMQAVLERLENKIYIDECNIFNLAHASMHGILIKEYFKDYCNLLERLNTRIFFLDIKPEISWQRREKQYRERIKSFPPREQETMMQEYKKYIEAVYPNLLKLYNKITLPKFKLNIK